MTGANGSVASADSGGFLVAFIICALLLAFSLARYVREERLERRPELLSRYRLAVWGTLILTVITGLRRFVLHQ